MSAMAMESGSGEESMTIGEVLSALSGEFADVTISKIRFLEAEGLIFPSRAPSGYRRFCQGDVGRLRLILTAQRDQYLPLRVIKDKLADGTLGQSEEAVEPEPVREIQPPPEVDIRAVPAAPDRAAEVDPKALLTPREVASQSGLALEAVDDLAENGVIERDPAGRLTGADVLVCRAFAALAPHGVEVRHLRQVKNGASRDVGLVSSAVAHLQQDQREPAQTEIVNALTDAHYWLVMASLNRGAATPGRPRSRTR